MNHAAGSRAAATAVDPVRGQPRSPTSVAAMQEREPAAKMRFHLFLSHLSSRSGRSLIGFFLRACMAGVLNDRGERARGVKIFRDLLETSALLPYSAMLISKKYSRAQNQKQRRFTSARVTLMRYYRSQLMSLPYGKFLLVLRIRTWNASEPRRPRIARLMDKNMFG
ncbi:unnamed protein product [Sphagnum tenellum]